MASSAVRMAARRPLLAVTSRDTSLWIRPICQDCSSESTASSAPAALIAVTVAASAAAFAIAESEPPNSHGALCRCDAFHHGHANATTSGSKVLRLQRRRTMKQMDDEANRESLESRYSVYPEPLGEGSYGEVYLATDRRTGEKLALKKIYKDRTDDEAFQNEMLALLHIRSRGGHPHVCALRENYDEGDHYVLILDLVRGGELFDHLIEHGAYSEADAARLLREVSSALAFLHGIGIVHADLKPENIMLSSRKSTEAAIKLVDFGCANIIPDSETRSPIESGVDDNALMWDAMAKIAKVSTAIRPSNDRGTTPAYCPPESFDNSVAPIDPSMDMWAVGIILYIMLCGVHPFDLEGNSSDEVIERRIETIRRPPLHGSPYTAHLSDSAIDLLSNLMAEDPKKRISANDMLEHSWVRGDTARTSAIAGSDKRLSNLNKIKTKIQAEAFKSLVSWSNDDRRRNLSERGKTLLERAFYSCDKGKNGEITMGDLVGNAKNAEKDNDADTSNGEDAPVSLSDFSDLLGENMKQRFFPRGHVVYIENDAGDKMYFINSGTVQVSTQAGFRAKLGQGDSFGEGGLLNTHRSRSATIKCTTPVHAIEIDEECFWKFLASSESALAIKMKEKVNMHKFGRAEYLIRQHKNLTEKRASKGQIIFEEGEEDQDIYIVEEGTIDIHTKGHSAYCLKTGDVFGAQSKIFQRPRRATAVCVSEKCTLKKMNSEDFHALLESSPNLKESIREICMRREFRRAVVLKLKMPFPSSIDLKNAFDAIDLDNSGELDPEEVKELMKFLGKSTLDDVVQEVIDSLDFTGTGKLSFDEFKALFGDRG